MAVTRCQTMCENAYFLHTAQGAMGGIAFRIGAFPAQTRYYMLKKTGCHDWKMFNPLKTLEVWANQELMDLEL